MSLVRISGMYGGTISVPIVQTGTITALPPPQRTLRLRVSDGSILTTIPGFARHFGALLLADGFSLLLANGSDRIMLQGAVK